MFSHSYALPPSRGPPIAVAFSDFGDAAAVLWEGGQLQLIRLQTDFEKGKEKPIVSQLVWEGFVETDGDGARSYRQVRLMRRRAGTPRWNIFALKASSAAAGSPTRDVI